MHSGFEPQKAELLEQYGLVEGLYNEATFARFTKLACEIFELPMSVISIIDADRIWVKASHGIENQPESNSEKGLCSDAATFSKIYIVNDTSKNEKTLNHSWVQGFLDVKFYVGYPLTTATGFTIGTLALMDRKPNKFSEIQASKMALLAELIVDFLEQKHQQIASSDEQHKKTRALAHDLKNPLTIVTLQAEMLMDDSIAKEDVFEMSQQISLAGRKINDIINKRLSS
jgi:sigma-B regulation protein RsbU (phosphoserine phosphatase)